MTRELNNIGQEVLRDRAAGCMIGLAIGDAFGDAARDSDNQFLYGITMDFPEKPTGSTDDTEFALLTAEILIRSNGEPTREDVVEAWRKHVLVQDTLNRGGASERDAAANIRRGILPPESGMYHFHYMSDGAAMRVTPAGIVAAGDPDRAAVLAERDAEISHWRDGIWGAQAVAAAVAVAMTGGTVDEIVAEARSRAPNGSWFHNAFERAFRLIEQSDGLLEKSWMPLHKALRCEYKAAVAEAVTAAFAIFKLTNGDFRQGIIYAGNYGRDSDTIGAIVGALAGAHKGLKAIPIDWVEKVRHPDGTCLQFTQDLDIIQIAHDLTGQTTGKTKTQNAVTRIIYRDK